MASQQIQFPSTDSDLDIVVLNQGNTTIPANIFVVLDTAAPDSTPVMSVRVPATAAVTSSPRGFTRESIPAGGSGRIIRVGSIVPATAKGAITKGAFLKISSVAGHEGQLEVASTSGDFVTAEANEAANDAEVFSALIISVFKLP